MELAPGRLLAVIKDRHVLINRLEKAMALAKEDNVGDVFKLNRLIKHQKNQLVLLEVQLKKAIQDTKEMQHQTEYYREQGEELKIAQLRAEVGRWSFDN